MNVALAKFATNLILFQAAWFVGALAPSPWDWLGGALALALQFLFVCAPREWRIIAFVVIIGGAIDAALATAGLMRFSTDAVLPLWLLLIWANFAATLRHSLSWLNRRPLLAAACGAVAGPFAYIGGAAISAKLEITAPAIFLAFHAPIWALLAAALPPLAAKLAD